MRITIDGEAIEAREGDTVAAAMLRAGVTTFTRSIKYHRPRGAFCFGGTCGQCLMRIDGVPSLPACRTRAAEGMRCERQNAPLGLVESDLFRATDFLFPSGLDHHHLMIRSRLLGRVALEVARRLAGLGELPATPGLPVASEQRTARVVVIGAGPAGLAAARAAGDDVVCLEREARAGGAALLQLEPGASSDRIAEDVRALGPRLWLEAECVGLYANEPAPPGNALVAVRRGAHLVVIRAERVVVATGGASQPMTFANNDRPGVYAARGLLSLPVRVGEKLVVAGDSKELIDCARALRRKGYALERVFCSGASWPEAGELRVERGAPSRALGNPVRAVEVNGERIRCDALAIALPPAPLHELATGAGARARWVPELNGFPVEVDAAGRTAVPWLLAAGRVTGAFGAAARASGEAAGKAALS